MCEKPKMEPQTGNAMTAIQIVQREWASQAAEDASKAMPSEEKWFKITLQLIEVWLHNYHGNYLKIHSQIELSRMHCNRVNRAEQN